MPELPEVETIARQLRARGVEGRRIISAEVNWPRSVEPLSPARFKQQVSGSTIDEISRVGKWLVFSLDIEKSLLVHLRMSGSFSMAPGPYDRVILRLSEELSLYFRDTRKFGRWKLVDDPKEILGKLGPDALTTRFSVGYFTDVLSRSNRMIKPVLLDQAVVAGLGNIYADEALWAAGIHPTRRSASLSKEEIRKLHRAIRRELRTGIKNRGTSLGDGKTNYRDVDGTGGGNRDQVKAYGRSEEPCLRCGYPLRKMMVAQRGTTFCPICQTNP